MASDIKHHSFFVTFGGGRRRSRTRSSDAPVTTTREELIAEYDRISAIADGFTSSAVQLGVRQLESIFATESESEQRRLRSAQKSGPEMMRGKGITLLNFEIFHDPSTDMYGMGLVIQEDKTKEQTTFVTDRVNEITRMTLGDLLIEIAMKLQEGQDK